MFSLSSISCSLGRLHWSLSRRSTAPILWQARWIGRPLDPNDRPIEISQVTRTRQNPRRTLRRGLFPALGRISVAAGSGGLSSDAFKMDRSRNRSGRWQCPGAEPRWCSGTGRHAGCQDLAAVLPLPAPFRNRGGSNANRSICGVRGGKPARAVATPVLRFFHRPSLG